MRSASTRLRCCRSWVTTPATTCSTGSTSATGPTRAKLPKLFWVNWFRRAEDGSFLWPGFGDNSRVLDWVLRRLDGSADAEQTPIGSVPTPESLNTEGLDIDADVLEELLSVDAESWRQEIPLIEAHYEFVGERLPERLADQLTDLEKRLSS